MSYTSLVFCGLIGLFLPQLAAAHAETDAATSAPDSAWRWDSGAVLATDRIFRGQRQTDGQPALSGEAKLTHRDSGAYAGIWAGNLDLGTGTDTHAEVDYFLGWGRRYGKWRVNTGYLYRQRPSDTMSLDYQEVTAALAHDFGRIRAGISTFYSRDYFQGGTSVYTVANLGVPITTLHGVKLIATTTAGHYDFSHRGIGDYNDADARLIAVRGRWQFSVGFSDTNVSKVHSGLLTRDRSGPGARAQLLVMF